MEHTNTTATMLLSYLDQLDTRCFYWINHHASPFCDWVMWTASQPWSWAAVLVLVFVWMTLRNEPRHWLTVLAGVGLCFLLSDQISVHCFKDVVCRLRPCHALDEVRMFRTSCGGQYGFVSSHAANIFSLALFFVLRYRSRRTHGARRHYLLPYLLFAWALLVGYSRPYLGKHYPGDVLCGAIVGLGTGALVYFLTCKIEAAVMKKKQKVKN